MAKIIPAQNNKFEIISFYYIVKQKQKQAIIFFADNKIVSSISS